MSYTITTNTNNIGGTTYNLYQINSNVLSFPDLDTFATAGGYTSFTIGSNLFKDNQNFNSINWSGGSKITTLNDSSFNNTIITSLDLSETNITTINNFVFKFCSNLSYVNIPSTVTNIGNQAFHQSGDYTSTSTIIINCNCNLSSDYIFRYTKFSNIIIGSSIGELSGDRIFNNMGKETNGTNRNIQIKIVLPNNLNVTTTSRLFNYPSNYSNIFVYNNTANTITKFDSTQISSMKYTQDLTSFFNGNIQGDDGNASKSDVIDTAGYTYNDLIKGGINTDVLGTIGYCFVKNTPIKTDQGYIMIQNLNPKVNTIDNQPILAIYKECLWDEKLIEIKPNAIGPNVPFRKTVITHNHKIKVNGEMIKVKFLLKKTKHLYEDKIKYIPYERQILYNILLPIHTTVMVNGMEAETLDPEGDFGKKFIK